MKSYYPSILIYFFIAIYANSYLIQVVSAVRSPVGLIFAVGFLAPASAGSAPDLQLQEDRTVVQVPNKEICGGRGPCTNGAACIDQVCECSSGWIPDPLITPVFDAGWRSCVQQNECLDLEMACNDTNAACVDRDPPERYVCVCPLDFTTFPSGSTDPSIECISSDDSAHPTTTPSSAAPAPKDTPAPGDTPSPNEKPTPDDLSCTRKCNSSKEFCLKNDATKGDDWPKCTCNQHFQRNANGDSCGMIYYCDSEASAQKSCPSPGTNCIQHGGGGGYFCMCMDGYIGGPNSEEGCVLTPAPTTSTPSLVPSVSLAPSIAPTTAPPTALPTKTPILYSCAGDVCPSFHKFTKSVLKTAVITGNLQQNIKDYGATNCWDVSGITDMSLLFYDAIQFNEDISCWDVSSVTTMDYMFRGAAFNQELNDWDVSRVTDMSHMFQLSSAFNQELNDWDVSSVTTMWYMFYNSAFNQELKVWDVSKVTKMQSMFSFNNAFNQELNAWDVSRVTDMSYMFYTNGAFNQDLKDWDVSKVTSMEQMFAYSSFNQELNVWDVSSVTDMSDMFGSNSAFYQNLCSWEEKMFITVSVDNMFFGATKCDSQDDPNRPLGPFCYLCEPD